MITKMNEMKDEKGFTLIELMIVIAIIGILASIALPQFATFRMRAFNTAGETDARTLMNSSKALFADYNEYGSTRAATGVPETGTILTAIAWTAGKLPANEVVFEIGTSNAVNTLEYIDMKPSAGVDGVAFTSTVAAGPAAGLYDSSLTFAKHFDGDKLAGQDSDSEARYFFVDSRDLGTGYKGARLNALPTANAMMAQANATVRVDDFVANAAGVPAGWKSIKQ